MSCIFLCCKASTFCSSCWWSYGWWVGYFPLLHLYRSLATGWRVAAPLHPKVSLSHPGEEAERSHLFLCHLLSSQLPSSSCCRRKERQQGQDQVCFMLCSCRGHSSGLMLTCCLLPPCWWKPFSITCTPWPYYQCSPPARSSVVPLLLGLVSSSCELLWAPGTAQPLLHWVF